MALEIEWNNKDPFFDRDLENFHRLHADGGISMGVIVTRGSSMQDGIESLVRRFAVTQGITGWEELADHGVSPTARQRKEVKKRMDRQGEDFVDAWAACFVRDKFGSATTHWSKLMDRLDRGVGIPCPIAAFGLPSDCVEIPEQAANRTTGNPATR